VLVGKLIFAKINGAEADEPKSTDVLHLLREMCEDEHIKFSPTLQSSDFFHCSQLSVFDEDGNMLVRKC